MILYSQRGGECGLARSSLETARGGDGSGREMLRAWCVYECPCKSAIHGLAPVDLARAWTDLAASLWRPFVTVTAPAAHRETLIICRRC